MRKVYCKGIDEQLYWAYKKDNIDNYIPDIIYKVSDNYEMLNVESNTIFKRWCSNFDL